MLKGSMTSDAHAEPAHPGGVSARSRSTLRSIAAPLRSSVAVAAAVATVAVAVAVAATAGPASAAPRAGDPAARGMDLFVRAPAKGASGGRVSIQVRVFGFP